MLRDLLCGWCEGRLAPRRFAVLWAVTVVAVVVLTFLVLAGALTIIEVFKADGSIRVQMWFGLALIATIILLLAAMFNITIKRGRDIGIPGFVTAVGFLALFAMGGLSVFLTIVLAAIPSDTFSRARLNS